MCICVHVCASGCVHVCMGVCMRVCVHVVWVCCVCTHVCMCVCVCMPVCLHIFLECLYLVSSNVIMIIFGITLGFRILSMRSQEMSSKAGKPKQFAILCLISWFLELECDPKGRKVGFIF